MSHYTGVFNGRQFWSGCVSLIDGAVEEVHPYEVAEASGFHHSLYFSPAAQERMHDGDSAFFWVARDDGAIEGEWRTVVPRDIVAAIAAQITVTKRNPRHGDMRAHYDFSKGRRNVYARLLNMPKLSATARRQLRRGTRVEMEHTRSRKVARIIAAHHLVESPRYYQALAKMERRLKRRNPPLGNTGWEFKQQAARRMLVEAIDLAGANPGAVDGLLVQAFAYAKRRWEQAHNRILPIHEYPALLHATTLELARMVASGEMTRP